MEKLGMRYQGKAKKLYETDDPDILWVEYTDQATAGNGAKKANIEGKARLNNRITTVIFSLLARRGIPSHFVRSISDTEQLNRRLDMFPLEIVMRNRAAGSFAQRYGVAEGTALKQPVLEFFYKSDPLDDPFINRDDILALGLATEQDLDIIAAKTREINGALTSIFRAINVELVDFKIEMGKTGSGIILLGDEITPDTCRLWAIGNNNDGHVTHLDKDIFRRDLGSIIPAYQTILDGLTELEERESQSNS